MENISDSNTSQPNAELDLLITELLKETVSTALVT
jgi:hypothetical protein